MSTSTAANQRKQALKESFRLIRLFLGSESRPRALFWIVALFILLVAFNGLNVVNSYIGRDFMTAIADRNRGRYVFFAFAYLGVFLTSAVIAAFNRFSEERLRLLWREWTTRRLMDRYLSNDAYYRINEDAEVDNPDQRMTDDVKMFTQTALAFIVLSLGAAITSVSFLGVLWSITPWLVLAALVYAGFGTGTAILLGRPLVRLNNAQLQREADLRYALVRARENAEAIAVADASPRLASTLHARLGALARNQGLIIRVTRNLVMFTGAYNYMIQIIPLLIVAPLYFAQKVEFGVVTQAAMAFAQVLGALSLIITQFETLSSFAAVSSRIDALVESVDRAQHRPRGAVRVDGRGDRIVLEGVTLRDPRDESREFVRHLSLDLSAGEKLLVTGPNPQGKRALFLALAGLWTEGEGRIVRPEKVCFLARRPLLVPGRLRDQLELGGPSGVQLPEDSEVIAVLEAVGLGPALERLDGLEVEHDWSHALSSGEQQRLSFARLLLAKPDYAIFDHVTDALPADQVRPLLEKLSESSIAYVSFAEDHDLIDLHDSALELAEDGGHRVVPAGAATAAGPQDSH
ncbi:ABC transporter ATP-binding protein/permease [Paludisphaera rhizosphaerae]|uniref:ABC transporter ATP-binding protein/permease n=1 Tax=Paludisphaera rhizosphaerae TaxID=2711216 RepID=UPI0013EAABFC|nr:SbmA/BacA-like family transporter [Paludisphaera rhizosphaerae]